MMKLIAAFIAAYLILAGGFCLLAEVAGAQDEILPDNAPTIQNKAVRIMTAEERSEILIYDIWKPKELDRIKIGKGAALGIAPTNEAIEPYGWQAFVRQDAISDLAGSNVAFAYGRM